MTDKRTCRLPDGLVQSAFRNFKRNIDYQENDWRKLLLKLNDLTEERRHPLAKEGGEYLWGTPELLNMLEAMAGPYGEIIVRAYRIKNCECHTR